MFWEPWIVMSRLEKQEPNGPKGNAAGTRLSFGPQHVSQLSDTVADNPHNRLTRGKGFHWLRRRFSAHD